MTVNAEPQVRSGSLPTNTPRTIQRPAQPAGQPTELSAAQADAVAAQGAQEAAQPAEKPKRVYKRRAKPQIEGGDDLSLAEQAAWGRIALKALRANVSVDRLMSRTIAEHGEEIAVYQKLTGLMTSAEQPAEAAEPAEPAVEA